MLEFAGPGRRLALVPNALDGLPDEVRGAALGRDIADLQELGFQVTVTDLHDPLARERFKQADVVWVRGGNVFVLRGALADTGADDILIDLIQRDAILYGGYSAGGCVLAPDLLGLETIDDISAVSDPIFTGLGLLDRPFVPHVRSPGHPETNECDALSKAMTRAGQPHWALSDGDVLLIRDSTTELLQRAQ